MSYVALPNAGMAPYFYQTVDPYMGPGEAPVPGWGINPLSSGPGYARIGVGTYSDNIPLESAVLPRYAAIGEIDMKSATPWIVGVVAGAAFYYLFMHKR
jgi:hypothetical protein